MSEIDENVIAAFRSVSRAFDRMAIRYYIGGSVASSFHGAMRSTMDIDVAAAIDSSQVLPLIEALSSEYYVSESAMRDAIRRRSCFNLIHFATSFKVDVFIPKERSFDKLVMERSTLGGIGNEGLRLPFATIEDIMILKFEWFRKGNETSERQWDDLSRLYQMHVDGIDHEYMTGAAASIQVIDLLERLRAAFKS